MRATLLLSHSSSDGVRQMFDALQNTRNEPVCYATLHTLASVASQLQADGVTELHVLPLVLTDGAVLRDARMILTQFSFRAVMLPALLDLPDFSGIIRTCFSVQPDESCLLLVHGTEKEQAYDPLCHSLAGCCKSVFLASLHGEPDLDTVLSALQSQGFSGTLRCLPLFLTAGHHMKTDVPAAIHRLQSAGVTVQWTPMGLCDDSIFRNEIIKKWNSIL